MMTLPAGACGGAGDYGDVQLADKNKDGRINFEEFGDDNPVKVPDAPTIYSKPRLTEQ